MQNTKKLNRAMMSGLCCVLLAGCAGAEDIDSQAQGTPAQVELAQTSGTAQGDAPRGERRHEGKGRMIESGSPYTDDWILDGAGRPVAREEWNPESRRYAILAKQGGSWNAIYSAEIDYEFDLVGLSADGQSLLARSPRGSDRFKVWTIPLAGGEPTLLYEHPQYDVTSVRFDRFTGAPIGYRIGGPDPAIVWTDAKLDAIHKAIAKATNETEIRAVFAKFGGMY